MADQDDERDIDTAGPDTAGSGTPGIGEYRVETPEADERLAELQRKIDEAKVIAADLAETTPDPLPDSEPPGGSNPGA